MTDPGEFFRALDNLADAHRELRDVTRDRDHWRALAERTASAVTLDRVLSRCEREIDAERPVSGPALAMELLSLAGEQS